MNIWTFTARIARDAEVRFTASGDAVAAFSCAVDSGYGDKKKTTWTNCSYFGKRGEAVAPYLLKGTQVAISGEVTNREYTDKDGNKRTSLDVRVNDITLLGSKTESNRSDAPTTETRNEAPKQTGGFADFEDNIPFDNPYRGIRSMVV